MPICLSHWVLPYSNNNNDNNTGLCKSPVTFRFSYSNNAGYVILGRIKQVWLHNNLLVYKA